MKIETDFKKFVAALPTEGAIIPSEYIDTVIRPTLCVFDPPLLILSATPEEVLNLASMDEGGNYLIMSATFRQSKIFFKSIEALLTPEMKATCEHFPDQYLMKLPNAKIRAVPMTEKVRGSRFNRAIFVNN